MNPASTTGLPRPMDISGRHPERVPLPLEELEPCATECWRSPASARYALAGKATKADKKWARAERITSALEIDPDNEIVRCAARVVWGLKRFDEVDGYIARGLAIAPESSSLRYLYGVRESMKAEKKSTVNAEIVQVQQMLAGDPDTRGSHRSAWAQGVESGADPHGALKRGRSFWAPSMMIMYRPGSRYGIGRH